MKPQLTTILVDLVHIDFYSPDFIVLTGNQNDIFRTYIGAEHRLQDITAFFSEHIPDDLGHKAIWELTLFMQKVFKWQKENLLS